MTPHKPPHFWSIPISTGRPREGLPIHEDFGVDLLTAETAPWPRLGDGCKGAFVHLKGRGDWMTVFLLEIPPGGQSAPQQHLFDELFYVLSGSGSMVVEMPDGGRHSFEWGPRSMFAPPLNSRYRIFNASGREPVRLASSNNLRILMNIFHTRRFLFDNPFRFPEREGLPGFYSGEGEMTSIRPGRNLWETNFVPDLGAFELKPWEARGAGSSNIQFLLSEGSMGAHVSEMPVGTYKKGHRHGAGPAHLLHPRHRLHAALVRGRPRFPARRLASRHVLRAARQHVPPAFRHQPAAGPLSGGRLRHASAIRSIYERRVGSEGRRTDVSIKEGGAQIEYDDQDPRIHALWLAELRKTGVKSQMGKFFDEYAEVTSTG